MHSAVRHLLHIPLRWKLVGANALLLSAGLIVLLLAPQQTTERVGGLAILFIAAAVNIVLVYLALVPLATIQSVAEAVTKGDYGRRVPPMLLADSDADRSRLVFNNLLDHLAAENARVRRMAGEVSQAREVERHALAHELREGVAQLLFALTLELGATAREQGEPLAGARARAAYTMANEAMEDLRRLAGTLAPAALTELGIQPALETLVRRVSADHDGPTVSVVVDPSLGQPPELVAQMLYRVAERAVRNIQSHGETKRALVVLRRRGAMFELDIEDDGVGVDLDSHDPLSAEPGLFGLREMLSQAGGDLRFECMRGERGTRVLARLSSSGGRMTPELIRVVVVDDHMVVRAGLKAVLQSASDIAVVGEGACGRDALALVERYDPDVVVMDLSMEPMDGAEATRRLHMDGARARVLVLTMHSPDDVLVPLMQNGASGFVEKHAADRELVDAVRAVARGDVYVQASAANALAAGVKRRTEVASERSRFEKLTRRERDVLRYVAEGFSAPEIGSKLLISPKTVDTYKQRIGEKLGLEHRSDYVHFALKLGILAK